MKDEGLMMNDAGEIEYAGEAGSGFANYDEELRMASVIIH